MEFINWYELNYVSLQEKYIELYPDEFNTEEAYIEIEKNSNFQYWCEQQFNGDEI
jgi:hypothetical protein